MSEITPVNPFEAVRGEDGRWSARVLQKLMGYSKWQSFATAIERAMVSAQVQGMSPEAEFSQVSQVTGASNLGVHAAQDYRLTRHAAYLVAMNGDPRKPEVAAAQAYFVVRTQEAEQASAPQRGLTPIEALHQMTGLMVQQQAEIAAIKTDVAMVEAKMESYEGHHDEFTALGFAKLHGFPCDKTFLSQVGKAATAAMRAAGREPRRRQSVDHGYVHAYSVQFLERAFALFGYVTA